MRVRRYRDKQRALQGVTIRPKLEAVGLKLEGNRIISVSKQIDVKPNLPLYNPAIHKPGDKVLLRLPYSKKLVPYIIPDLDAGGQAITDYW